MPSRPLDAQVFRREDDRPATALLLHEMWKRSGTRRLGTETRPEETTRQGMPVLQIGEPEGRRPRSSK